MSRKNFLLSLAIAMLAFLWLALGPGPLKENKIIVINTGSILNVARQLKEQDAINNEVSFVPLAKLANFVTNLKAGEYELRAGSSAWDIIRAMQSGNFLKRSITVPEGHTTNQAIALIAQHPHLLGIIDNAKYKEGELLPETYFFIRGESKTDILHRMSESMKQAVDKIWEGRDKTIPLKNKYELIVLASIVEKEAKLTSERSTIASVFINRLRKNMKLESDPTTIYAITGGKYTLARLLTRSDLRTPSPFNTYFAPGLPPTPIANPGMSALVATANPAATDHLFFVVKDCQGSHNFSSTVKQHTNFVRAYRKLRCK